MKLSLRHWQEGDSHRAVIRLEHAGARVEKGVEVSQAVMREASMWPYVFLDTLALRLDELGQDWDFRFERMLREAKP